MSKIIKKIAKLLIHASASVVLVAIMLSLAAALALSLPRIQTLAATTLVDWLSLRTESNISIGAISLENITRLSAKDLYIEDLQGDTLLYVGKLSGNINRHRLLTDGELLPSNIAANNVVLNIITEENRETNIDNLVAHIASAFPPSNSAGGGITIENVWLRNMRFRLYDPLRAGSTPEGVIDYSDMNLAISDARFKQIAIDELGGVHLGDIEILSAIDTSGAKLENSTLEELSITKGTLDFRRVNFYSDASHLRFTHLTIAAESWEDYADFNNSVTLSLNSRGSILQPQSAGRFVDVLGKLNFEGEEINGSFDGTLNDFFTDLTAKVYHSDVLLVGTVENITSLDNLVTDIIVEVGTTPDKIDHLYRGIFSQPLPREAEKWVAKFDTIVLTSELLNEAHNLTTDTYLTTPLGEVAIEGDICYQSSRPSFDGWISGYNVEAGRIVGEKRLGNTNFFLNGHLEYENKLTDSHLLAEISDIEWDGYEYNNIDINANLQDKVLSIDAQATDANLAFTLNGNGNFADEEPEYDLLLHLEKADLSALGFAHEDNNVALSAEIEASLRGERLDDMVGRAMINNLFYATAADTLSTDLVNISLTGGEHDKSFALTSHVATVNYRSGAPYKEVLDFLTTTLPSQLPLGADEEDEQGAKEAEQESDMNNYGDRLHLAADHTAISINILDGEHLVGVILPGTSVASGSQIEFEFSPSAGEFNMMMNSEFISTEELYASDITLDAEGSNGVMSLNVESSEIVAADLTIPDVSLQVGANANDMVTLDVLFSNADNALSGQLSLDALLRRLPNGEIAASATFKDSYLLSPERRWDITAQNIDYDSKSVRIDNFKADSGTSSISLSGAVSDSQSEPLKLQLTNFQIGEWLDIILSASDIKGSVDGDIELFSTLAVPFGRGSLTISSLSAGSVAIDPMNFDVRIPRNSRDVNFSLKNTMLSSTLVQGRYNYETSDYVAGVTINELDLSLFNSLLKGALSGTTGNSQIFLNLSGERDRLNINGDIRASQLATTIDFTGARYTVPALHLHFDNNQATINPARIEDNRGGWANAEGYVDLKNLNSINYGLRLEPHNFTALSLAEGNPNGFYGNIYTSGAITLNATRGITAITGNIRTDSGSEFNIPIQGNNDFSGAEFVTFVDRSEEKRMAEESYRARERFVRSRENQDSAPASNVTVDLGLEVDRSTLLRILIDPETDNILEARGDANLNVTLDSRKNDISVRGDYQISEGVYNFNFQNLISREFNISPGSYLRWTGDPLDAMIDISAAYRLRTSLAPLLGSDDYGSRATTPVDCIINLTGSLNKIDVGFDINVPTANTEYQSILSSYFSSQEMMATQFVYLLTVGNFYSNTSGTTNVTPGVAGLALGFDLIAAQIGKLLSNDKYEMKLKYKAIDDTSSSYGFDFQTKLGNFATLEIEANVGTGDYYQNLINNNNPITGSGAITFPLNKKGNFYLKGFTRTIDRFDENQGLQEGGLGLYYQQSFDRFGDLWRKKRGSATEKSEKSDNFVAPSASEEDSEEQ